MFKIQVYTIRYEICRGKTGEMWYLLRWRKLLRKKKRDSKFTITLDFKLESHREGSATYFREYLRDYMKKWVDENKKPDGSDYDIYKDGLKIYTTIDSRMQLHAEEAVSAHMANLQEEFFIQAKE
jgi:penicillin-binding protein 1A